MEDNQTLELYSPPIMEEVLADKIIHLERDLNQAKMRIDDAEAEILQLRMTLTSIKSLNFPCSDPLCGASDLADKALDSSLMRFSIIKNVTE